MKEPQRGEVLYEGRELKSLNRQWNLADWLVTHITLPTTLLAGLGAIAINLPRILPFFGIQVPQLPAETANIACFTPMIPILFGLATAKLTTYAIRRGEQITDRSIVESKLIIKEIQSPPKSRLN